MGSVPTLIQSGRTLNIAHRGALDPSRANSLEGICESIAFGIDAIEVDVQITNDGIPVLFHDRSLPLDGRKTKKISDQTLSELATLEPAGRGLKITPLRAVLDKVRNTKTLVVLDIKSRAALDEVTRGIRDAGVETHCLIASFDHLTLVRSKRLSPEIPTVLILGRSRVMASPRGFIWTLLSLLFPLRAATRLRPNAILCPAYRLTRRLVGKCRKRGIAMFVWNLKNITQSCQLLDYNVQGMVTDWPVAMRHECHLGETPKNTREP
jgi:glycerophosphoryl diester phosphodiesterase